MEQEIRQLLERFYEGETTLAEEQRLRRFFSEADLPGDLAYEKEYFLLMMREKEAEVRPEVAEKALQKMEIPLNSRKKGIVFRSLQIAASLALAVMGYWLGYHTSQKNLPPVAADRNHAGIQQLLSLDHPNSSSAAERILALDRLAGEASADDETVQALINTLHFDPNVNVRMAALDALRPLASNPSVRYAFVQSLTIQRDPILQVSLIESLAGLNEKRAIRPLIKMAEDPENLEAVRQKAREAVSVIQAEDWWKEV